MSTETPDAPTATATASDTFGAWLDDLSTALSAADASRVTALLAADCWWRDLLALSWDLGTYHGTERIAGMLDEHLKSAGRVRGGAGRRVRAAVRRRGGQHRHDRGVLHLPDSARPGAAGSRRIRQVDGVWRAWTVMTGAEDLKGHERALGHRRPTGPRHETGASTQRNWKDKREAAAAYADRDPDVVILGAGQGGLALAANLRLMGVDALILEKSERVGDGWRKRYHSLVLHDPVWADHLPYLPFPQSWPIYSRQGQDRRLVRVLRRRRWSSTSGCSADMTDRGVRRGRAARWTLAVQTPEGERTITTRDVVLATGAAGEPNVPDFPGRETFGGTVYHSSRHRSGGDWAGKKAIVVGACNSGHDIAQDLHEAGADVTLVQRSSTHIISQEHGIPAIFGANFTESGPPTEYADLLAAAFPWPLVLEAAKEGVRGHGGEGRRAARRRSKPSASSSTTARTAPGLMGFALAKGGGYYIDVGASGLIATGQIALAQGSGLAEFTPTGIRLADGRELDADLVVLATGYSNMRETARRLFGRRGRRQAAARPRCRRGRRDRWSLPTHRPGRVLVHGWAAGLGPHLLQAPRPPDRRRPGRDLDLTVLGTVQQP